MAGLQAAIVMKNNDSVVREAVNSCLGSKDMDIDQFDDLQVINKGSFGRVYRAWDRITGQFVAIKHEFHGFSKSTLREINIHKSLPPHPNIIGFKGVFVDQSNHVLVVMDYVDNDLRSYMNTWEKPLSNIRPVKFFIKQLLEGVKFLHENGLMHRDLKPSNILIDNNFQLKICDFGLSRRSNKSGSYTPRVGTLWYKAPELLIGSNNSYSSAVDMWSVGCIMAELIMKEVIFKGNSEIDQLGKINMLGCSSDDLNARFAVAKIFYGAPLLTTCGVDLISRLLAFNPNQRITAEAALNHPWFKSDR